MSAVSIGYLHTLRTDEVWFIALPFIAVAIALFFHTQLPYIAQASIAIWITVPPTSTRVGFAAMGSKVTALQAESGLNFSAEQATGFYAATAVSAGAACHDYLGSYIGKIREAKTREGL